MGESSYLSPVSGSEILENSQTLWQIIGCVENIIHMQTDMWSQGMTCQAAIFTPSSLPPHLTLFLDWPGQEQEDSAATSIFIWTAARCPEVGVCLAELLSAHTRPTFVP